MSELVLRTDRGGLATLTLNRPDKLNALTVPMFLELRAHIDRIAEQTDEVGLVMVRGAGKCFSAGNDLAGIAVGVEAPKPSFQSETIELLANLPQPVISAVHGHCYTGALGWPWPATSSLPRRRPSSPTPMRVGPWCRCGA
jgi:enoyl-CoA hydratase/carnithine racemase